MSSIIINSRDQLHEVSLCWFHVTHWISINRAKFIIIMCTTQYNNRTNCVEELRQKKQRSTHETKTLIHMRRTSSTKETKKPATPLINSIWIGHLVCFENVVAFVLFLSFTQSQCVCVCVANYFVMISFICHVFFIFSWVSNWVSSFTWHLRWIGCWIQLRQQPACILMPETTTKKCHTIVNCSPLCSVHARSTHDGNNNNVHDKTNEKKIMRRKQKT